MTTNPNDTGDFRQAIRRVIVSREQIAARVAELAETIAADYAGRELTILAVLTGSIIFAADLIRQLPLPMRLDLASVSSYPGDATKSAGPKLAPITADLRDKLVLIVDDIFDTGQTLAALRQAVTATGAASIRTCVLLARKNRPATAETPDYVGHEIGDEFVVGYGLDFNHRYRNLPYIGVLRQHAQSEAGA